ARAAEVHPVPELLHPHFGLRGRHADADQSLAQRGPRQADERRLLGRDVALERRLFENAGIGRSGNFGLQQAHGRNGHQAGTDSIDGVSPAGAKPAGFRQARSTDTAYLHSWAVRSSAWASPLSEYLSVLWVPLADVPFTTRSPLLRMASTMRASSAAFLIQAPSFCVYMENLLPAISTEASLLALKP